MDSRYPYPESRELRELVENAQAGDAGALEQLLELHLPALQAYVRLQVNPRVQLKESCSDLAQSVCREVLTHLGQFEFRGQHSFRNWMLTAALNKIRQKNRYYRAEKRDPAREVRPQESAESRTSLLSAYASICSTGSQAAAAEQMARIESAFDRLPEHYREVITQCRLLGLPQREVALRMDRSEASVRNLLNRALVRLAGMIDEGHAGGAPA